MMLVCIKGSDCILELMDSVRHNPFVDDCLTREVIDGGTVLQSLGHVLEGIDSVLRAVD
jgi:hypothetical protein